MNGIPIMSSPNAKAVKCTDMSGTKAHSSTYNVPHIYLNKSKIYLSRIRYGLYDILKPKAGSQGAPEVEKAIMTQYRDIRPA